MLKKKKIWGKTILQSSLPVKELLSVPGGRLALFLFLLFSEAFSRGGHSGPSGPLEPLNWSGSLLVAGSKDRALSPGRHKPIEPHYSRGSAGAA